MSSNATAAAWLAANESAGPSHLTITLLDNTTIELALKGTEPAVVIACIFYSGYFRGDDGVFYNASQIRSAVPRLETNK
jgi:hypothetical protein